MSSMQSTKDMAQQTKNYGAEKTGQAQESAQGMGQTTKDKAAEGKDHSASAVGQASEKVKEGMANADETVTGKKQ